MPSGWPQLGKGDAQGIEVALRESVPEITRVIDVTDHAAGANPYYEAAKK